MAWLNLKLYIVERSLLALLAALLLCGLFASGVHAQSDALVESYNRFQMLIEDQHFEEAAEVGSSLVELAERDFGASSSETGSITYQVGRLNFLLGRMEPAEPLLARSLAIFEETLGADNPGVAMVAVDLGAIYRRQGRYELAEEHYGRALRIREDQLGPDHPDTGIVLNDLAELFREQGLLSRAEPLLARSLEIDRASLGSDHPELATSLNNLALIYELQGRYEESESLHKQALAIKEQAHGLNALPVANTLNNLAGVYRKQGRYGESEEIYRRALAINQGLTGSDSEEAAIAVNNLAVLAAERGQWVTAEELYRQALAALEAALGSEHHRLAAVLNGLAQIERQQGDTRQAESLLKRALAIQEQVFDRDHFEVGITLNNLATLYEGENEIEKATSALKRALAIFEQAFGETHPLVASALANLASLKRLEGDQRSALEHIRRTTAILRGRAGRAQAQRSAGLEAERKSLRPLFGLHLKIAGAAAAGDGASQGDLLAEAFDVTQLMRTNAAAQAVARMAARFAAGDDALAALIRERQNLLERWLHLDAQVVSEAIRPLAIEGDPATSGVLRAELAELAVRLDKLDGQLAANFPEYAEIANPQPLSLEDVKALLRPTEAILAFVVLDDESYVFAIRSDDAKVYRAAVGAERLRASVTRLRATLTPDNLFDLEDLLARGYGAEDAARLYQDLFAPAEEILAGARHVFVVPDDALQSLPLAVLLTEPAGSEPGFQSFADYRQAPWLARKYALTTLPSISSLRALRRFARSAQASKSFLGFGDPTLEGPPGMQRGIQATGLFRGALANVRALRELSPLPETATELRQIAKSLASGDASLRLGPEMTELAAKSADLSDSRVIAFATHGLLAGELYGTAEPALVFTPPAEPSQEDDGLLTASEIARELKLDAEWVILSACNTAAGDTPGAEGLSGLAKAFFYAGSRTLLVSHWPVVSQATVQLTTRMFDEAARHPEQGRGIALQRSILAMIDETDSEYLAHPLFWAPFVVVGEGGIPARADPG